MPRLPPVTTRTFFIARSSTDSADWLVCSPWQPRLLHLGLPRARLQKLGSIGSASPGLQRAPRSRRAARAARRDASGPQPPDASAETARFEPEARTGCVTKMVHIPKEAVEEDPA